MATRTDTGVSRRALLGLSLLPLLLSGQPLQAMASAETSAAVARLLHAALPAHHQYRRPLPLLPFSRIETALARLPGRGDLGDRLLARLDLTPESCQALPINALRERLQQAVRDDFRQGLIMEIDGWYLSQMEGIVCVLSHERGAGERPPGGVS